MRRHAVTGGLVADGDGGEPQALDVLIEGERIAAVATPGSFAGIPATDASGLVVAPGFIDAHSHADNAPFLTRDDTTKILQGVTTEIVGNCGFSLAPRAGTAIDDDHAARLFPPVAASWTGFPGFLAEADARGYVTNHCPLVGHGTLRVAAFGVVDRPPAPHELAGMRRSLREALDAGAFGLSSGLIYPPGAYAGTEELAALVSCLGPGHIYATHLRAEGGHLIPAIEEALTVAEKTGRRTQISHLKSVGRPNRGGVERALALLDRARATGVAVRQDAYPYDASSTSLTAALPPHYLEGGAPAVLARLRRPGAARRLAADLAAENPGWENRVALAGWDALLVTDTPSGAFVGRTLAEIARDLAAEPVEALVHVLVSQELRVSSVTFWMDERDVRAALAHPCTMIGSDGLPPGTGGRPHPRLYGTFPRILGRYVREAGLFTLGEAVHRMTALPAAWFGVPERGRVAPGTVADLVAFDPATVRDTGDYRHPDRAPEGIAWVAQAGRFTVRQGRHLGVRAGRRLLPA
ncbi:D-aminoacylase [Spongiactinospora sp. TRM90649]|uniref:N-acyl-D-amino-acid deacylase family protein n=1 Tax=Spongiactinospora sp. TRM90649 TaxID=3031114 RepID=UPI0023F6F008|nr:D-aminoacylase [Spongiactinospora sp. TRM90649]MDF5752268.1 D-aminoacylase [Spongiactinospora sp. TRM90649]